MKTVYIASDHAGYELKEDLKKCFSGTVEWVDYGCNSEESCDYPDMIHPLAADINSGKNSIGIILCGSGIGVSMVANKYANVRAALCWNKEIAMLSRQHNDANVLALPARFLSVEAAKEIVQVFLSTSFEGGRHSRRVEKIRIV